MSKERTSIIVPTGTHPPRKPTANTGKHPELVSKVEICGSQRPTRPPRPPSTYVDQVEKVEQETVDGGEPPPDPALSVSDPPDIASRAEREARLGAQRAESAAQKGVN